MLRPHKKGSVFLEAHLPPPPSIVKKWIEDDKRRDKKLKRKTIKKIIPAKVVRHQLKTVIEGEIPALHAALQTAQYHRENDARIHNGTIGDLLLALNVKQTACRMKEKHIAEQKTKISALNQEIVSLRKELSKEKEENRKWDTIEQEMQEIHFDEYVFDILYSHLCLNFQKCTLR